MQFVILDEKNFGIQVLEQDFKRAEKNTDITLFESEDLALKAINNKSDYTVCGVRFELNRDIENTED
jgi:hypothetical protein